MIGAIVSSIPRDSVAKISIKINIRHFCFSSSMNFCEYRFKNEKRKRSLSRNQKNKGDASCILEWIFVEIESNERLLRHLPTLRSAVETKQLCFLIIFLCNVFWSSFFAMFFGHLSLQCFLVIFLCNACSNRYTVVFGKESILSNDWGSLDIAFVCLARCEWHHQMRYHVYISTPPNITRHACRISMN